MFPDLLQPARQRQRCREGAEDHLAVAAQGFQVTDQQQELIRSRFNDVVQQLWPQGSGSCSAAATTTRNGRWFGSTPASRVLTHVRCSTVSLATRRSKCGWSIRPWRRRTRHTPLADSRSSLQRGWVSSMCGTPARSRAGWRRARPRAVRDAEQPRDHAQGRDRDAQAEDQAFRFIHGPEPRSGWPGRRTESASSGVAAQLPRRLSASADLDPGSAVQIVSIRPGSAETSMRL